MPDHIHLLIEPGDKYNISKIMQFIKRHFSRNINYILFPEDAIGQSHRRGGDYENFMNIIYKHDNKIKLFKNQFIKKYGQTQFQFPKFQWQKSFYDHYIRNDIDFENHLEYIWCNPEKHKITNNFEYYSYSSYNNYIELIDKFYL